MGLPKSELVSYARAYMFQQQTVQMAEGIDVLPKQPSERAADALDYSMQNFTEGSASGRAMMAQALCRFLAIHIFCFALCLCTLLVAMGHIHV